MLFKRVLAPLTIFLHLESTCAASLPLRIVSSNIRSADSHEPGEKSWSPTSSSDATSRDNHALFHFDRIITGASSSTIFGLQEVLDGQLNDIVGRLGSGWTHVGVAKDDGAKSGEYNPIVYRGDQLDVEFNETKWLSPTPDTVSTGWGASSKRIVTIAVFKDIATEKSFIHANTQLDDTSSEAQLEGIKVVVAQIKAVQATHGQLPVLLTGDFNSQPDGDAYKALDSTGLFKDLWSIAVKHPSPDFSATWTGWSGGEADDTRIDYVWLGPEASFTPRIVQNEPNSDEGLLFSDHRPVVGDVTIL